MLLTKLIGRKLSEEEKTKNKALRKKTEKDRLVKTVKRTTD